MVSWSQCRLVEILADDGDPETEDSQIVPCTEDNLANVIVIDPDDRTTVVFIARKILDIADEMDDPNMQRAVRYMAERVDPAAGLKPSQESPLYDLFGLQD